MTPARTPPSQGDPSFDALDRPLFASAVVVEATKTVAQGIPAAQTRSRRVLVPVPAAQGLYGP